MVFQSIGHGEEIMYKKKQEATKMKIQAWNKPLVPVPIYIYCNLK